MNSKKAITLLVLATMLLALVPVIPVSALVTPTTLATTAAEGKYNEEKTVIGTGVTPGSKVELYWDYVQTWDGTAGIIAATIGKPAGTFEIKFKVPEAIVGAHYLWIKDVSTGAIEIVPTDNAGYAFDMIQSIKLSNANGLPGDLITVSGYGFNITTNVDYIKIWNSTKAYNVTASLPKTSALGSWSNGFTIPSTWNYGAYQIIAADKAAYTSVNVSFTIGPSISINKKEGPSGTVVTITGRGFNASKAITSANVKYNSTAMYVIGTATTDADGVFTLEAVIPSAGGIKLGTYPISVNTTTADFKITGLPGITTSPAFQVQGGMFTITGTNYTQIADKTVTVKLNGTVLGTVKTTASGTFTTQLRVPAVTSGVYKLYAQMADYGINKTISYRVGIMLVILSSESGPTGEQVTVTATGFTGGGHWNMTVGGKRPYEVLATNNVNPDGSLSQPITIPTLPVGVHSVSVYDIEAKIAVTTEFEVTQTTAMTADPVQVPAKFNVTLSGKYFTDEPVGADADLTFWVYNSTGAWSINVWNTTVSNPAKLLADGTFKGTWTVSKDLAVGPYTVNVTDGNKLWAKLTFNIVDKTVSIDPRKSIFRIGETVAFNVESSFSVEDSYIKIWEPSGSLYWQTDVFSASKWVSLPLSKIVPFYSQTAGENPMMLLDDAPVGQYTWKWYDTADEVVDSGVFTVQAAAADVVAGQVKDLANQITDLASQLTDVTGEFAGVKSSIASVAALAQQAVTAAQQAAQAVQTVATTANQANTAAQAAADAAKAAEEAANGLTTLVYGAIGASLVAALAAIVSLMQISRRIAG